MLKIYKNWLSIKINIANYNFFFNISSEMIESIEIKLVRFFFYLIMIKGQTKQRSKEKGQKRPEKTLHRKLMIKQHKPH